MYQKFTKTKNLLTVAMLFVFCAFTNSTMAQKTWYIGYPDYNSSVIAKLNGNTLTISGNGNMVDFWSTGSGHIIPPDNETNSGGEAPWWFNTTYRNAIQFVTIENGVTNIGQRAFKDCGNLQSITIPNSVVKINDQAFYNCTNLLAIANLATTPQNISSTAFQNTAAIYLATPEEATAKYKTTDIWKNFKFAEPYILSQINWKSFLHTKTSKLRL